MSVFLAHGKCYTINSFPCPCSPRLSVKAVSASFCHPCVLSPMCHVPSPPSPPRSFSPRYTIGLVMLTSSAPYKARLVSVFATFPFSAPRTVPGTRVLNRCWWDEWLFGCPFYKRGKYVFFFLGGGALIGLHKAPVPQRGIASTDPKSPASWCLESACEPGSHPHRSLPGPAVLRRGHGNLR